MTNDDPPEVFHRHLILCRTVWFTGDLDDGFSLGRLVVHLRPRGGEFPFRCDTRLFLFAQLFGTPGEYTVRARLVRVIVDDDEPTDGHDYGPWTIALYGEEFVESFAFPLEWVPFPEPGVYEFQLSVDEVEGWYAAEQVEVRSPL